MKDSKPQKVIMDVLSGITQTVAGKVATIAISAIVVATGTGIAVNHARLQNAFHTTSSQAASYESENGTRGSSNNNGQNVANPQSNKADNSVDNATANDSTAKVKLSGDLSSSTSDNSKESNSSNSNTESTSSTTSTSSH